MAGPAKSKQKVLPLASGPPAAGSLAPSLLQGHDLGGPPRRTIPGPSRLSRHPCRSTPYAMIPLGLLMGRLASPVRLRFDDQKQSHSFLMGIAALNPSSNSADTSRPCRSGPWPRCFCCLLCPPQIVQTTRSRIPSGGRVEVLCRGAFGMDAKRGTMGQGWPTVTTLGTVPERGKLSAAKPGCRARFLFGYFLFRASKEKVTRRKGEELNSRL